MTLAEPFPAELTRIARKVVWYDAPDRTLRDMRTFLAHLMEYGTAADVSVVKRFVPDVEFRKGLADAPAGVFTSETWMRWHERFGILPLPPLPRRRFPDGTFGPEAGGFLGR